MSRHHAGLPTGFVILKGYVIARGDLATALGILQYAGLVTVVTAGLLSSLPRPSCPQRWWPSPSSI
jgi:hypothetical protein